MDSAAVNGRIVANYGRRVMVEAANGQRQLCIPKGRRLGLVCGDWVNWTPSGSKQDLGIVQELLPRTTVLERPNNRGQTETLASNITQLLVVVCHKPMLDAFLIDRYTVAAELMGITCVLIWNKIDLVPPEAQGQLQDQLEVFRDIGYNLLKTSAKHKEGLDELKTLLAEHTSILVGQSGVGKSSLLNALIPGLDAATAEISKATGEGKHTTTTAILHHLESGGEIIDSPGIRDYAPALVEAQVLPRGFLEFAKATPCRFNDCSHLREPGCGVVNAVAEGIIDPRRFESYRRLANVMNKLQSKT